MSRDSVIAGTKADGATTRVLSTLSMVFDPSFSPSQDRRLSPRSSLYRISLMLLRNKGVVARLTILK